MEAISIGRRREVFWDDFLIDPERTTAISRLVPPVEKECVFLFDREEEVFAVS